MQRRGLAGVILVVAAIVGFALGAWLGQVSQPKNAGVASAPSPTPSPTPTAAPVQTSAPPSPTSTAAASKEILLTQSGSGNFTSDSFVAKRGWQVQWQTDADPFALSIRGDPDLGTISDHPGPATGVVSPQATGTFRIEIKAKGSWTVTVLQGAG